MPLKIALTDIAQALDVTVETARSRMKGVPFGHSSQRRNSREYDLAAVLGRLYRGKKQPSRDQLTKLFEVATDDGSLHVGDGSTVMAVAELLATRLPADAQARFQRVRFGFTAGLSNARGGAAYLPFLEALQLKLLLHSDVLRQVILGTPAQIDWRAFAPAFALVNGGFEPTAGRVAA